jgi:hypothetical protein
LEIAFSNAGCGLARMANSGQELSTSAYVLLLARAQRLRIISGFACKAGG